MYVCTYMYIYIISFSLSPPPALPISLCIYICRNASGEGSLLIYNVSHTHTFFHSLSARILAGSFSTFCRERDGMRSPSQV